MTLSAIQQGIQKLQQRGYTPINIVLLREEAECMLSQNFLWKKGQPFPDNIELLGLPVIVQE